MEDRKKEHLHLAFEASISRAQADPRFMYEPMLSAHPNGKVKPFSFLGKKMNHPFWISSMTGGTQRAGAINVKLAKAAGEFGLGMGLGSCRVLFESDDYWDDFKLRSLIGDDYPFYANLGIAQLEKLLENKESEKIDYLNQQLKTDGTIIHINPLQEAFQPEGDKLKRPPIECIQELLEQTKSPIIVKEVGQGMGMESIRALLKMNIAALEFGALGGTNFTKLEQMRRIDISSIFESFTTVGHTAEEMTMMVNQIVEEGNIKCKQIIISGGIKSLLDGYYLTKICKLPAVIGMGSAFLNYALKDYEELQVFIRNMVDAWQLAEAFLKVK
ncbi:isopentenyl-diphosphate delta-isomerase [Saccharicrinis sp. GN24d3]|uniref:isopentenyl-diphosphate delta-isomerase n=1 Tax=Saccharicrinis sp. GN24d3 TaxID=3458416 RepID=UPI0040352F5E